MKITDPQQLEALQNMAQSQVELGQWRQARKTWLQILKQSPGHLQALLGLARLAQSQRQPKVAARYLQQALEQNPHQPEAVLLWCQLQGHAAAETRLQMLEQALEQHPRHPELLETAADTYLQAQQIDKARFYLEHLLSWCPKHGVGHLKLAQVLLRSGELEAAARAFEVAVQLEPELRHDARWIDFDGQWQKIEAQLAHIDLAAFEQSLIEQEDSHGTGFTHHFSG